MPDMNELSISSSFKGHMLSILPWHLARDKHLCTAWTFSKRLMANNAIAFTDYTHTNTEKDTLRDPGCISAKCFSECVGTHSSLRLSLPAAHSNYHSAPSTMGRADDEWTIMECIGCMYVCAGSPFIPGVLRFRPRGIWLHAFVELNQTFMMAVNNASDKSAHIVKQRLTQV